MTMKAIDTGGAEIRRRMDEARTVLAERRRERDEWVLAQVGIGRKATVIGREIGISPSMVGQIVARAGR